MPREIAMAETAALVAVLTIITMQAPLAWGADSSTTGTGLRQAAPASANLPSVEVVPETPGAPVRMTLKFRAEHALDTGNSIIVRLHDSFDITDRTVDGDRITIHASSILGGALTIPQASGVINPTSATVTFETVERYPQIRLTVPDMSDAAGIQHIETGATVAVVFGEDAGITNPTGAGSYFVDYAIDDDAGLVRAQDVIVPVVVGLSSDGGQRGALVTAVAKGG